MFINGIHYLYLKVQTRIIIIILSEVNAGFPAILLIKHKNS